MLSRTVMLRVLLINTSGISPSTSKSESLGSQHFADEHDLLHAGFEASHHSLSDDERALMSARHSTFRVYQLLSARVRVHRRDEYETHGTSIGKIDLPKPFRENAHERRRIQRACNLSPAPP